MKSDCCDLEVIVNTSNEGTSCYVCKGCGKACDVVSETQPTEPDRWACAACGAEGLGGCEELLVHLAECEEYFRMNRYVLRLTPEQWARVRWPSEWGYDWLGMAEEELRQIIEFALQDLKPQVEDFSLKGEE